MSGFDRDLAIVGGCGHVGLPLGLVFADAGASVVLYDVNQAAVEGVNGAQMPFHEDGALESLQRGRESGRLLASTDPADISSAEHVVVIIGTPVDEHLNPDPFALANALRQIGEHLRDGQMLILRSTIYPGLTALIERTLAELGLDIDVSFCPERIAEGKAMTELGSLPQIVSARTDVGFARAEKFFRRISGQIVRLEPEEAELAKLFTNSYRYIKFAIANQFWLIANEHGLDYERIRQAVIEDYPRAKDLPGAGFAAGPCLLKDTMQLAAFNDNGFTLGHSSMMINEGMPLHLVSRAEQRWGLAGKTVGILGMAFKADSDDRRDSLSYKLRRLLRFRAGTVLCTDPHVTDDPSLVPLEQVLAEAEIIFIGAPHSVYAQLVPEVPVVDIWNLLRNGVMV